MIFYEVAVATVLAPIEHVISINKRYFRVYKENRELKVENAELKFQNETLKQYEAQNHRLREMLSFKSQSGYQLIPGEIVARDPGRYEMTWIINLGRNDSLQMNMPVLTSKGVIGKVAKVFYNYSVVQLIHDPNCKISVIVQRSRVMGILESFQLGKLIARFPSASDVRHGDSLYTSGMGGVFPKGLSVGVVGENWLEKNDIVKGAEVFAFENTDVVEEVFVLRKKVQWMVGGAQ